MVGEEESKGHFIQIELHRERDRDLLYLGEYFLKEHSC